MQKPTPYNHQVKTLVEVGETDDPGFVEVLNSLLEGLTSLHKPEALWIIQIDNWFDHKWLKFSGTGGMAIGKYDSVKVEFYQDKLTFPPFTPKRVMGQWSYMRTGDDYREAPLPAVPHSSRRQSSPMNLQRRIQDLTCSACFAWYSGNTVANGRGSVMVYNVGADEVECWFAAFKRQEEWKLQATKGMSPDRVEQLLERRSS